MLIPRPSNSLDFNAVPSVPEFGLQKNRVCLEINMRGKVGGKFKIERV